MPAGPDAPPRRIFALAPSLVEILFALDLGERVVGVGDHSRWPGEAASLPRLGGLYDPNLEAIAELRPELAVLLPSQEILASRLLRLGVEVLVAPAETLDDVEEAFVEIAGRCGVEERGVAAAAAWRDALAPDPLPVSVEVALLAGRPAGELAEIVVAGPGTFLDELLLRLGCRNAFAESSTAYPQVPLEEILRRRPEAVVELQPAFLASEQRRRLLSDWRELERRGGLEPLCVPVVDGSHTLLPGPRLPRLYQELRRAILDCLER